MSKENQMVNCDTRVKKQVKEALEALAKRLGVKRSDLQRAAFNMILDHHRELEDGEA